MIRQGKGPFKPTLLIILAIGLLTAAAVSPAAHGIAWDPALQVPMELGKLTLNPSAAEDSTGRVWLAWSETTLGSSYPPEVFFKYRNTFGVWVGKFNVSASPSSEDFHPSVMPLANETMMIMWSSNRTGNPDLFYRRYASVSPIIPPTQLTSHPLEDRSPSMVQDRDGRIWVVWERKNSTVPPGCNCQSPSDIYYKYYDGVSWSQEFPLPAASSPTFSERAPTVTQTKDGRIWIGWASDEGGGSSLEIFVTSTDGTIETLPATGIPPVSWAPEQTLFVDTKDDDNPAILQSRDGIIWAFWQQDTGSDGDIRHLNSLDNGATWGRDTPTGFASTTATESSVSVVEMGDNRIWVFWNKQGPTTREIWYTTSAPITGIHDVGVSGLTVTPKFLRTGDSVTVQVKATNYGDFSETTTLTVRVNNTIIFTVPLSLADGETQTHQVNWTSTWGRNLVTASLSPVTGENVINQGDNNWPGRLVRVTPPGDIDFDGDVDILDAALLAFAFGSSPGSPVWNPDADINKNGTVDILDAAQLAFYFGKSV
jgi:hypothetical protein